LPVYKAKITRKLAFISTICVDARRTKELFATMKKSEFVVELAKRTDTTQTKADDSLNAVLDLIQETLVKGEKLTLTGFGTFEVRERKARNGVNIRTGKPIKIPAGKRPVFTAGAVLKDSVSGKKKAAKKPAEKKPAAKPAAKKK
jgi:DNA-binding protein HU-beta